jgi:hypothetical protein
MAMAERGQIKDPPPGVFGKNKQWEKEGNVPKII